MPKYLDALPNLSGKRALVRVDFNVPLAESSSGANGHITDDRRMREAIPTINELLAKGAAVVLMSHMGRPKGKPDPRYSLRQIQDHLAELLGRDVLFANDCIGQEAFDLTSHNHDGDVVLLENLRYYNEEEKGDRAFAEKLAKHGDIYVNDAFGTAHRPHASVSVVTEFFQDKYAGYLMRAEVENAQRVLDGAQKPYVAIVGGAKVSDKILVIENLLKRVNTLIIGGGMAYTFLKAQGKPIGKSLVEEDKLDLARELMTKAEQQGVQLLLPVDSVIADDFNANANSQEVTNDRIPDGWMGLDIGAQSRHAARQAIMTAKTVLWNGPMGVFEFDKFAGGTIAVAEALAEATDKGAFTLVGGGDSAAAIEKTGLESRISFVSTGGGALLEYLEGKTLPGIAALG